MEALDAAGYSSVLPQLDSERIDRIAQAGKMPKRAQWSEALSTGEVGLDALFTLAGLYSFAADQAALDERILKQLGFLLYRTKSLFQAESVGFKVLLRNLDCW